MAPQSRFLLFFRVDPALQRFFGFQLLNLLPLELANEGGNLRVSIFRSVRWPLWSFFEFQRCSSSTVGKSSHSKQSFPRGFQSQRCISGSHRTLIRYPSGSFRHQRHHLQHLQTYESYGWVGSANSKSPAHSQPAVYASLQPTTCISCLPCRLWLQACLVREHIC